MKRNKIWMVACMVAASVNGLYGCDDDKDFSYNGNLDLNLLGLKQAREIWDGSQCNIKSAFDSDSVIVDFSYDLSLALYQNRKAEKDVVAGLIVDADTLTKAAARADEGGIYTVYANAELLPADYYILSSDKMELPAGKAESDKVELIVYQADLTTLVNERKASANFVLPLKIKDSSSYTINEKTNTMMFFFTVTYVPEVVPSGSEYEPDTEGVPDDHTLTGGYKLLWHDEFNGTGIPNPDMWRFEEGFQRNEEDQWYQSDNARMNKGALVFTAKKERVRNPNYNAGATGGNAWKQTREYAEYTSSCIVAKGDYAFKYGKIEVRAKIPIEQGAWPAIWSTGNWYEWPLGGEIDILEFYKEKIHANLCWGGSSRWNGTWNSQNYPISKFTSADSEWADKYHIWRMDWDENYIRIYLDDELLNETDLSTTVNKGDHGAGDGGYINPYSNNFNGFGQLMMLNLAIGGINGRPVQAEFPLEYCVDYVRVYQK